MSFIIAFVKIMVAMLMVVFFGGKIRGLMLISLGVLFVSTILYESARENKNTWLIFFLVGIGYPLRFFVGFIVFITNIYLRHRKKIILICVSWISIIYKMLVGLFYFQISIGYILFSIVQMIITGTYFILCYQPQIKKIDYKKIFRKIKEDIILKIVGEYAFSIMNSKRNDRN